MDEFSLLERFFQDGEARLPGGEPSAELRQPCGLGEATPLADGEVGTGLVVVVDGQSFDLGEEESSVTLADCDGLSVYSDMDGDGEVDHVTTVRFDGTWESWNSPVEDSESAGDVDGEGGLAGNDVGEPVANWDAYTWEQSARGNWG